MAINTLTQDARTALTVTGLGTLASATYVVSEAFDATGDDPVDVVIEVEAATTNTPTGNKQLQVFVQASLDGVNFQSGPVSGTTTTDEADLTFVGTLPMGSSTTIHRKMFSVGQALGFVPQAFKIVLKNDLGVALTSGAVYTAQIISAIG